MKEKHVLLFAFFQVKHTFSGFVLRTSFITFIVEQ